MWKQTNDWKYSSSYPSCLFPTYFLSIISSEPVLNVHSSVYRYAHYKCKQTYSFRSHVVHVITGVRPPTIKHCFLCRRLVVWALDRGIIGVQDHISQPFITQNRLVQQSWQSISYHGLFIGHGIAFICTQYTIYISDAVPTVSTSAEISGKSNWEKSNLLWVILFVKLVPPGAYIMLLLGNT